MTESQTEGQSASRQPAGLPRRVAPELLAALTLAVLGSAASPFAPPSLPLHWGLGENFGSFASSWVVLLAVPWSCVVAGAVLTSLPRYRERPHLRLSVQLLPVISLACLLVALLYVALGSPPLSGPQ